MSDVPGSERWFDNMSGMKVVMTKCHRPLYSHYRIVYLLCIYFWCGPFLKPLLNLVQYCFCLTLWFFGHEALELSSLTRDWTYSPCLGKWSLNHWTAGKVPISSSANVRRIALGFWTTHPVVDVGVGLYMFVVYWGNLHAFIHSFMHSSGPEWMSALYQHHVSCWK